jgi:hypothetical protein
MGRNDEPIWAGQAERVGPGHRRERDGAEQVPVAPDTDLHSRLWSYRDFVRDTRPHKQ